MTRSRLALLFVSAMLSFGQSAKTKECADQSEKVAAQIHAGDGESIRYSNHYSPRYDRCFIEIQYWFAPITGMVGRSPVRGESVWIGTELQDAFERSRIAFLVPAKTRYQSTVEGESVNFVTARAFIAEHMKN